MKTYEEKAESVLKRIHEQTEVQKKRKRIAARLFVPVMSLSLAVLLGLGVWESGMLKRLTAPIQQDRGSETDRRGQSAGQEKEYAVYTDSVKLPEHDGSMTAVDMIGCLVYKGSVYTQSISYDDVSGIEHIIGDYVGETKGILDEGSTQKEWATEFASTYSGAVYTVKGYSPNFRLCIYIKIGDSAWLQFLDNYDGIGLNTGKDLFEDRLHIKNNVAKVTFLPHDDWDHGSTDNYQTPEAVTQEQLHAFIDTLCSSPFERIDYKKNPGFYNAGVQGHLYLEMTDGTQIELRLIEGGYVGCQELGWVFVKMPGALFDAVMAACQ